MVLAGSLLDLSQIIFVLYLGILLVAQNDKGDISVNEGGVSCHLMKYLGHNTKSFSICWVNNEEDTVDISVVEWPWITVAAL